MVGLRSQQGRRLSGLTGAAAGMRGCIIDLDEPAIPRDRVKPNLRIHSPAAGPVAGNVFVDNVGNRRAEEDIVEPGCLLRSPSSESTSEGIAWGRGSQRATSVSRRSPRRSRIRLIPSSVASRN